MAGVEWHAVNDPERRRRRRSGGGPELQVNIVCTGRKDAPHKKRRLGGAYWDYMANGPIEDIPYGQALRSDRLARRSVPDRVVTWRFTCPWQGCPYDLPVSHANMRRLLLRYFAEARHGVVELEVAELTLMLAQ